MSYDALFLHPPSIYDFRRRVLFPGPIDRLVPQQTYVFTAVPIGLLSIADYLDRHGYRVKVLNLGERMLVDKGFDADRYLKGLDAEVFGVDLHWCVHAQGAIEVARLLKGYHPSSLVVFGGLTASRFGVEVVQKYPFIDAVVVGECEEPVLKLLEALEGGGELSNVPNLVYRGVDGGVRANPLMKVSDSLDDYEFARLDLLEPTERPIKVGGREVKCWSIPICRGCLYNCLSCGGSAYSYKALLNRERPAFRSPMRIVDDLQRLRERGVEFVFLFQDARMGGPRYWRDLFKALRDEGPGVEFIYMELFEPADREFLRDMASVGRVKELSISPESGVDSIRLGYGRPYTTSALLETVKKCQECGLPLYVFFTLALPGEGRETLKEMWALWRKLLEFNVPGEPPIIPNIGPILLLDPGSLAFDYPERYGYRLRFKSLEDYYRGMSMPCWSHYVSYETESMSRRDIVELTLLSQIELANLYEEFGLLELGALKHERFKALKEGFITDVIDEVMAIADGEEMTRRLKELEKASHDYEHISGQRASAGAAYGPSFKLAERFRMGLRDPYGYRLKLKRVLDEAWQGR